MPVVISSHLRGKRGGFTNIRDVKRYDGDRHHVEGAVVITIDGYELMTERDWDDVDMLWALLVQAVNTCRTTPAPGRRTSPTSRCCSASNGSRRAGC